MAEVAERSGAGRHVAEPPEAAERGSLEVRDRALVRIVEQVVLETPGAVRHRAGIGEAVTTGGVHPMARSLPRVEVDVRRRRARVTVEVAAAWPTPVGELAHQVRDNVLMRAADLSGTEIRAVDVTVHLVARHALARRAAR